MGAGTSPHDATSALPSSSRGEPSQDATCRCSRIPGSDMTPEHARLRDALHQFVDAFTIIDANRFELHGRVFESKGAPGSNERLSPQARDLLSEVVYQELHARLHSPNGHRADHVR